MTRRIASQSPFILLPRYGEKYEGMARQIKDVIGVASKEARTPEELAFAEYVASNTVGARLGRAINKRQIAIDKGKSILNEDQFFGAGSTIDPFLLPYKSGFDRTINDYLSNNILPYKGDKVERMFGIDYQDRLAAIAHIPKIMERWENLPKVSQQNVYRGNDSNYRWTKSDMTVPRFTSASQSKNVANIFAYGGGSQIVNIYSQNGRRIAAKDAEQEVLFAPNSRFKRNGYDSYVEMGASPLPKIPSYEELKQMSKIYGSKVRQKEMAEEYEAAKAELDYYNSIMSQPSIPIQAVKI
jgi:hypothetical protein